MQIIRLFAVAALLLFLGGCWGMEGLDVDFVTGVVMDTNGRLVDGAVVTVTSANPKEDDDRKEFKEITDGTGNFSVNGLDNGKMYKVTVSKEGYVSQTKTIKFHSNTPSNLSFVLSPGYGGNQQGPLITNQGQQNTISPIPYDPQTARVYVAFAQPPQAPGTSAPVSTGPGATGPRTLNEMTGVLYGSDPMGGNLSTGGTQANPMQQISSNHISLMDFNSHKVVAVVPVNARPYWILFHPSGRVCYVVDETKRILVLSPMQNNAMITAIGVGDAIITDLAVTATGDRLFAALRAGTPQVAVIDAMSNQVVRNFTLPQNPKFSGAQPGGIAVTRDGSILLVTMGNVTGGELLILDSNNGNILGRVNVGSMPLGVGVTPDGLWGVVANYAGASVSIVDIAGKQAANTITVGTQPAKVAIRPDGRVAYVTNSGSGTLSVIDPYSKTAIAAIPVGQNPMGVAVSADGRRVYIANNGSSNVTILDSVSNTVIGSTAPVQGSKPYGIGVRP